MQDKELIAALEEWIAAHREELVRDVIGLVNIRSVMEEPVNGYPFGEGPAKVIDRALELGERYGFATENSEYHTASFLLPGETERELGIMGHVDVVHEGGGWTYAPFDAVEVDGHIVGRGASDNKGPSVAALYVLRALRDLGVKLNHMVRVIWGANEETGMEDVKHFARTHTPPEFTLVCDAGFPVCCGEKGILTADLVADLGPDSGLVEFEGGISSNAVPAYARMVVRGSAGEVEKALAGTDAAVAQVDNGVEIVVHGVAGHAAAPERGDSAIRKIAQYVAEAGLLPGKAGEAMAFLAQAFGDYYGEGLDIAAEDDISGKTTHVGGMVRLEGTVLRQNINVRYAIRADQDKMLSGLHRVAEENGFRVENLDNSKPRYDSPEDPRVKLLVDTSRELVREDLETYVMGGGTHARYLPNAVPYGPGVSPREGEAEDTRFGSVHGRDEAVRIDDLTRAVKVYAVALARLDRLLK